MIRIQYNEMTGRVIGTEIVDSDSASVQDCVDDISEFINHTGNGSSILKDNLYFIEGKLQILDDMEPDYFDKRKALEQKIANATEKARLNNDSALTERLLSGMSINEALQDMREAKNNLDILTTELEELDRQYQEDLQAYYEEKDMHELSKLNPEKYSAVCLLIRDENKYLEEWIRHYIQLGIDLIVIYDNGINESVKDVIVLMENSIKEKINIIPYHDADTDTLQQDVYNDFINKYRTKVQWGAFVDSDEFIELVKDETINDFLKQHESYGSVHMNWVTYNANGQIEKTEGSVVARFTQEVPEPKNHIYRFQGKDFMQLYKVERLYRYHPVFLRNAEQYMNENLNLDIVKLNHYYTKSLEEWKNKISRGSCDSRFLKSYQEFFELNPDMGYLNTGEDYKQKYNSAGK